MRVVPKLNGWCGDSEATSGRKQLQRDGERLQSTERSSDQSKKEAMSKKNAQSETKGCDSLSAQLNPRLNGWCVSKCKDVMVERKPQCDVMVSRMWRLPAI